MAATKENPIVLYDVASKDGSNWSSNTIRTRLALNYKGIPYRVHWVQLNQIESTLKALGVPPAKSSPHYTLPTIADPSSDPRGEPTCISDTFNIALYLDNTYLTPKYPAIFPEGTRALQKAFIDNWYTAAGVPLYQSFIRQYFPEKYLTEAALEYLLRSRGATLAAYAHLQGTEFTTKLEEVHQNWGSIAETIRLNQGEGKSGPFVMGDKVTYADFAIGGMIFALNRAEGDEGRVWKEMMKWSDGIWSSYWKEIKAIIDNTAVVA